MPRERLCKRPLGVSLLIVAFQALLGLTYVQAADPLLLTVARDATCSFDEKWWNPKGGPRDIAGVQNCYLCHARKPGDDSLPPGIVSPGGTDDGWVLLNEVRTWGEKDKHYQAYAVLLNDRSQKMARSLGVVDKDGKSVIHRDKRCLACHSSWPVDRLTTDPHGMISEAMTADPRINLGVSCEGCHGPSLSTKDSKGWNDIHRNKSQWRFLSPQDKFNTYGYWNVRSPVTRARICLSCHLGNVEQGKLLTHEMYAAGHPPLPPFEISTFIDQEPQHWRDFGAKTAATRDEYLKETKTTYDANNLHRSRATLVGALMGMSETLKLSADLVDPRVKAPVSKSAWPELANFSCFACHHDLAAPGWRQPRVALGFPGRPALQEWPDVLSIVALNGTANSVEEHRRQMQPVRQALRDQPFGEPARIQDSTRKAAEWYFNAAAALEKTELSPADGWRILHELCLTGSTETLDYDSARLLVWACHVIYDEVRTPPRSHPPGEIGGWYRNDKDLDDVDEILSGLKAAFALDLRDGRQTKQLVDGQQRPQTEVELKLTLPFIADYAPEKIREQFKKLDERIELRRKAALKQLR